MRFVIGLLAGSALVLLLAPALDPAAQARLRGIAAALEDRISSAAAMLVTERRGSAGKAAPDPVGTIAEPGALSDGVAGIRGREVATSGGGAAPDHREPAAEPALQPIPRPPDPDAAAPENTASVTPEREPPQALAPVEDVRQIVRDVFGGREPAPLDGEPAEHPVWVPFHSEMSAAGFAERLSESLDHPFRVERRGPGRYQVVFGYQDEVHRRALLAEASQVTGLPL